jgi:hypothetical protein
LALLLLIIIVVFLARWLLAYGRLFPGARMEMSWAWTLFMAPIIYQGMLLVTGMGRMDQVVRDASSDNGLGIVLCIVAVHLAAGVYTLTLSLRHSAELSARGFVASMSRGLVFLTEREWDEYRTSFQIQLGTLLMVWVLGAVLASMLAWGLLLDSYREWILAVGIADLFLWMGTLYGSRFLHRIVGEGKPA